MVEQCLTYETIMLPKKGLAIPASWKKSGMSDDRRLTTRLPSIAHMKCTR